MQEIVRNGLAYKIPSSLTPFQEKMYIHLIDWKRRNICKEAGVYKYKGQLIEYDAILPETVRKNMPLIYCSVVTDLKEHKGKFDFRFHQHFHHMASSQAANINLFLPILLSPCANDIFQELKADFKCLATEELYKGFRIEYWDGNTNSDRGLLKDHSAQSGTDSDIAIAYYNNSNELCLWIIEHKLTEKAFSECGGFKSKDRNKGEQCCEKAFSEIIANKDLCFLHHYKGREYWNLTVSNLSFFINAPKHTSCPFKGGMNQLWRNQLLGLALEEIGVFKHVYFSVVKHPDNTALDSSINEYKNLINNNPRFSVLNSNVLIKTAQSVGDHSLNIWAEWYKELYKIA